MMIKIQLNLNLQMSRWMARYGVIDSLQPGEQRDLQFLQWIVFAGVEDVNLGYLKSIHNEIK